MGEGCTGPLDGYPLAGAEAIAPAYLDRAWAYFVWLADAAAADGTPPPPVSLTQVVAGTDALWKTVNALETIVGLAEAKHYKPNMPTAGASVFAWRDNATVTGCRSAHEYGHTLGLPHDLGVLELYGSTYRGFMQHDGGSCIPVLGPRDYGKTPLWNIGDVIEQDSSYHPYEAWSVYASQKSFPRWDGYAYIGCYGTACPLDYTCKAYFDGGFVCW